MFLSYRRFDVDEVRGLERQLRLRGVRTWRDVNDLHLGGATEDEILQAIAHESDAFALYATPRLYEADSTFIWHKELPAADQRWRRERYPVIALYRNTGREDLSNRCAQLQITDFGTKAVGEWIPRRGDSDAGPDAIKRAHATVSRQVLRTVLDRRLTREGVIALRSFPMPDLPSDTLLDLDWTSVIEGIEPDQWASELFPSLHDLAEELERRGLFDLTLYPHARLTLCVAFGIVFPLASRFRIRLMGREGEWVQQPGPAPLSIEPDIDQAGDAKRALLAFGFTRDLQSFAEELMLTLKPGHVRQVRPSQLNLASQVRPISTQIGAELRTLAGQGVSEFHIVLAAPAPLAIAVGRQLHALGQVSLYYADADRKPALAFTTHV